MKITETKLRNLIRKVILENNMPYLEFGQNLIKGEPIDRINPGYGLYLVNGKDFYEEIVGGRVIEKFDVYVCEGPYKQIDELEAGKYDDISLLKLGNNLVFVKQSNKEYPDEEYRIPVSEAKTPEFN